VQQNVTTHNERKGEESMKKIIATLALVTVTLGGSAAFAGKDPATGVNGSWHDITALGLGASATYKPDNYDRVCIFCHTPHNAQSDSTGMNPLWSHKPSAFFPTAYSWAAPANQGITFNADPLIGPSRLCMSCHDGATAVDSHSAGGTHGLDNNGTTAMNASATGSYLDSLGFTNTRYFDQDGLNRTHPIGFKYSDAVTKRTITTGGVASQNELVDVPAAPTTKFIQTVTPGNPYNTYTYREKYIADGLYGADKYVTCASCHDVHNKNNSKNDAVYAGASPSGAFAGTGATHAGTGGTPNFFVWAPE
jgi:hypothetical protein